MEGCAPRVCSCSESMSNTGTDCGPLFAVAKKLFLTPIFDSTGTRNGLDLTNPITLATFTALVNQVDSSKRLYPVPELKNINDTRNDPIVETFDDNSTIFIGEGIRNFEGFIVPPFATPQLKGSLNAVRCNDMGVYIVDRKGSLRGILSSDGTKLYPYRMDSGSFSVQFLNPTNTVVPKLQIRFAFHADEDDACQRMLTPAEMDNANLLVLNGLLDVFATFSSISQTGAVVKLETRYGDLLSPTRVEGLVDADFISSVGGATSKVRNTTDGADVAVTATEGTGANVGIYTLAWASQTVSDIIVVKPKLNGYDFSDVEASPITIV